MTAGACRQPVQPGPPPPPDIALNVNPMVPNWNAERPPAHVTILKIPGVPAPPFEVRAVRDTALFHEPEPDEENRFVGLGTLMTALKDQGPNEHYKKPNNVREGIIVELRTNVQNAYFGFWPDWELVKAAEVVSAAQAGQLTFAAVPEGRRSFCESFADRLEVPPRADRRFFAYSVSADDSCYGYVSLIAGVGKGARAVATARREGPLVSAFVREGRGVPPLLDVTEWRRVTGNVSGQRRVFLSTAKPALKELLVLDQTRDEVQTGRKLNVASTIDVVPNPQAPGLLVLVHRTDSTVELPSGKLLDKKVVDETYRYDGQTLARP